MPATRVSGGMAVGAATAPATPNTRASRVVAIAKESRLLTRNLHGFGWGGRWDRTRGGDPRRGSYTHPAVKPAVVSPAYLIRSCWLKRRCFGDQIRKSAPGLTRIVRMKTPWSFVSLARPTGFHTLRLSTSSR